ncbi:TetR/AcrR family transcriptional regulator [Hoeflea prorocentri]|uniref:TetR/AcrR family transcriptional regulator n=1 Tax=Hoeflea prorocentri TaxID=1922333 RepID=A0A9X3ZIF0_9HYPH|nr:TetR/AcrR family transcriptional regulator [Hoeflea prorocentri]MCY6381943.1 TetR/AcrR family transcriptional regulator [Hoeflea prorocentri]MDA5399743.1 TetR/AcrR family transcriptional regulator [Hoeflea prorocentri]
MSTNPNEDNQTEDKKTQILNAATRLLTAQGLQTLSFEAVANEAGLSRQLVRYYYSDLDVLMVDLCIHLQKVYQEVLVTGIVEVAEVERLGFFLDFLFGLSADHPMPDNLEAYDALFAYSVGSAALKERLCEKYKTLGQVIVHELAIAHPGLDHAACQELSFLIVSMMHAHWSYVATLGFSPNHNRLARGAIDRLIASYVEDSTAVPSMETPWSRDG